MAKRRVVAKKEGEGADFLLFAVKVQYDLAVICSCIERGVAYLSESDRLHMIVRGRVKCLNNIYSGAADLSGVSLLKDLLVLERELNVLVDVRVSRFLGRAGVMLDEVRSEVVVAQDRFYDKRCIDVRREGVFSSILKELDCMCELMARISERK
ncbi:MULTISPECIES: hypothetical protein [Pseudomonas]|uniref:hypothetical protein n=1 Tax=Pseudomonas TaxID=286 RepID=UPI002360E145|nr:MULTISPECIES: hypothetical protein [Pseudomonas]WJV24460.1 hypothetical protein PSR66_33480 [Pseudomonas chlororaphis]